MKPRPAMLIKARIALSAIIFSLVGIPADAESFSVGQKDAENNTSYEIREDSDFYFTESVNFSGYSIRTEGGPSDGSIFRLSDLGHQVTPCTTLFHTDKEKNISLIFSRNTRTETENGNHATLSGGMVNLCDAIFRDFQTIVFEDNYFASFSHISISGGTIGSQVLNLDNVGQVIFKGNTVTGYENNYGGAASFSQLLTGRLADAMSGQYPEENGTGDILVWGNSCLNMQQGKSAFGGGFYNPESQSQDRFTRTGTISFRENRVGYSPELVNESPGSTSYFQGGAYAGFNLYFSQTGLIEFIDNTADGSTQIFQTIARGGAIKADTIYFEKVHGNNSDAPSLVFSGNRALASTMEDNGSYALGGAIDTTQLWILESGHVLFENNYATTGGGAIYLRRSDQGAGMKNLLSADAGNITFRGNTTHLASDNRTSGLLNAITVEEGYSYAPIDLYIRAQEGFAVEFFDPVTSSNPNPNALYIYLNTPNAETKFDGTIRFSGAYVRDSLTGSEATEDYDQRVEKSKLSELNARVYLEGGILVLEEGVTFGRMKDQATPSAGNGMIFHMTGGLLEINGSEENGVSTLRAEIMTFDKKAQIRIGTLGRLEAGSIDMSNGLTIDLSGAVSGGRLNDNAGLIISTANLSLGGVLALNDLYEGFYRNPVWQDDAAILIFDVNSVTSRMVSSGFDGIVSSLSGTSSIDDPDIYMGEWSLSWNGSSLYAVWDAVGNNIADLVDPYDPDPAIPGPDPFDDVDPLPPVVREVEHEFFNSVALNSLWSSASNMRSLSDAALGQAGIYRFLTERDTHYWALGLGDFTHHNEKDLIDGYEYRGGGYAAGVDHRFDHFLAGIAFGQTFGTSKSKLYASEIDQKTLMGLLYAAFSHDVGTDTVLNLQASLGYANTDNTLTTNYENLAHSEGSWDNNTFLATLQASWDIELDGGLVITPFIGLEFIAGSQKSFDESGDLARSFDSADLRNLALPVGIGFSRLNHLGNGMKWYNSIRFSYIPDVYRSNPSSTITWEEGGLTWDARGVSPSRNAGRVELYTRLQVTDNWGMFAGYTFEGRDQAYLHHVNAGVSFSF